MYKEERNVLQEMKKKKDECGMDKFGTLDSSEKTFAILGDRWWPQTAKQEGDKKCETFVSNTWKKGNEHLNFGGASY